MKNLVKTIGIIALIAVIGTTMVSCGGSSSPKDFKYGLTGDGQGIVIQGYTGKPGKIVVPSKIEGLPVVEIGAEAFNGKTYTYKGTKAADLEVGSKANEKAGITSIIIPNTVKKIGYQAFANTAIKKFDMPDSVTEIGEGIFSGCSALTEVRLSDNIERITPKFSTPLLGGIANSSLKKINLPKNLKYIGSQAFVGLSELTELVIPNTLESVEFGKTLVDDSWVKDGTNKSVQSNAFMGCSKLPIATRQKLQSWGYTGDF